MKEFRISVEAIRRDVVRICRTGPGCSYCRRWVQRLWPREIPLGIRASGLDRSNLVVSEHRAGILNGAASRAETYSFDCWPTTRVAGPGLKVVELEAEIALAVFLI